MNESERYPEANPEMSEKSEITKDELIAILRQGAKKPEAVEMMQSYLEQEEAKAGDSMELRIISTVKWGLLLVETGYRTEALDALENAQELAAQEEKNANSPELKINLGRLYWDIQTEIDKINGLKNI